LSGSGVVIAEATGADVGLLFAEIAQKQPID
jgi:hypothetical protein